MKLRLVLACVLFNLATSCAQRSQSFKSTAMIIFDVPGMAGGGKGAATNLMCMARYQHHQNCPITVIIIIVIIIIINHRHQQLQTHRTLQQSSSS